MGKVVPNWENGKSEPDGNVLEGLKVLSLWTVSLHPFFESWSKARPYFWFLKIEVGVFYLGGRCIHLSIISSNIIIVNSLCQMLAYLIFEIWFSRKIQLERTVYNLTPRTYRWGNGDWAPVSIKTRARLGPELQFPGLIPVSCLSHHTEALRHFLH